MTRNILRYKNKMYVVVLNTSKLSKNSIQKHTIKIAKKTEFIENGGAEG